MQRFAAPLVARAGGCLPLTAATVPARVAFEGRAGTLPRTGIPSQGCRAGRPISQSSLPIGAAGRHLQTSKRWALVSSIAMSKVPPSRPRRAALPRGRSVAKRRSALCRKVLERCFAALRPRRSAALQGAVWALFSTRYAARGFFHKPAALLGRADTRSPCRHRVHGVALGGPIRSAKSTNDLILFGAGVDSPLRLD